MDEDQQQSLRKGPLLEVGLFNLVIITLSGLPERL